LVTVTMCNLPDNSTLGPKLRMTQQRRLILEQVRNLRSHPTAEEIYERVRAHLPRISLATVYRNLEKLCQRGLIRRLELSGTRRRYDSRLGSHYHVRCLGCGQVDDVEVDSVKCLDEGVGKTSRYTILGHRLVFFGLCPLCAHAAEGKSAGADEPESEAQEPGASDG
jgi:Fur family ferric uptake transcriptional regulator